MTTKPLPFTKSQIEDIIREFPTPFHIYYEKGIRDNAKKLKSAFSWADGFKEYFAVKATPNPHILKIMKDEGFGADCSSLPELIMAERVGITEENIMFSSNNTPAIEYQKALKIGAIINLDDINHLSFLEKHAGLPELICFRYNPGPLRTGNNIIGLPEDSKYGVTKEQIFEGHNIAKGRGVKRFGLHTMIVSNELNPDYLIATARMLFELAVEILEYTGIKIEFVNIGGGFGIPYEPDEDALNYYEISKGIEQHYNEIIKKNDLHPLKLFMECGRVMTGPYGFLVSRVLHLKRTYKNYAGIDACMSNLMRPAIYGEYHHITVLGKEELPLDVTYDVTGSLCENNDKFAIDRKLPKLETGDIVVIHDTGAHGHAMGFNYNGKLRSSELLLKQNGEVEMIRRAETLDDYFITLKF